MVVTDFLAPDWSPGGQCGYIVPGQTGYNVPSLPGQTGYIVRGTPDTMRGVLVLIAPTEEDRHYLKLGPPSFVESSSRKLRRKSFWPIVK